MSLLIAPLWFFVTAQQKLVSAEADVEHCRKVHGAQGSILAGARAAVGASPQYQSLASALQSGATRCTTGTERELLAQVRQLSSQLAASTALVQQQRGRVPVTTTRMLSSASAVAPCEELDGWDGDTGRIEPFTAASVRDDLVAALRRELKAATLRAEVSARLWLPQTV